MPSGETTAGLDLIRAGLADLASRDIDGCAAAELAMECEEILRAVGALHLQAARRLARFEALGGPASDDAHSLAAWLGQHARLRPWEAGQLATTASHLHLLEETTAACARGEIGFGDVATIAEGIDKAATTMSTDWTPRRVAATAQPILLEAAASVTPGQLRKAAAKIALTLDGEDAEKRRRQIERQAYLDLAQTIDGVGIVRADVGAADFAVLEKAIDAFAPRPDPDRPLYENRPGHRRLRGLVTACEIALRAAGEFGYRERGGAPVRVHLIVTEPALDPCVPSPQAPIGRTEFGTVVSAAQIREMLNRHHADITTIRLHADGSVADRFTADGQPLNWGRTKRLFTPAQRDVYLALFAGCAADGCDRPVAWSAIDHQTAWADGGRTDLDNGAPRCDFHNLSKENRRKPGKRRGRIRWKPAETIDPTPSTEDLPPETSSETAHIPPPHSRQRRPP